MSETVWIVQTTLPGELNEAEVGMWCQSIIDSNLAACVDIKRTNSVFRWEGEIKNTPEWDIQMRTPESKKGELISTRSKLKRLQIEIDNLRNESIDEDIILTDSNNQEDH